MIITPDFSSVSLERLLKRYGDGRRRTRMEPIYRTVLAEAALISQPAALVEEYKQEQLPELSSWLSSETTSVALALCTLGDELQRHIADIAQNDILSAVVFEEISLACVTAITRQIHGSIRTEARKRGLKAGPAHRPGLGRWPIETQLVIFDHLAAEAIGVTLSEQLVMTPKQSTSLIIPLFDRN